MAGLFYHIDLLFISYGFWFCSMGFLYVRMCVVQDLYVFLVLCLWLCPHLICLFVLFYSDLLVFCLSYFVSLFLDAVNFLLREKERNGAGLHGWGSGEYLRSTRRGETVIRTYCMKNLFSEKVLDEFLWVRRWIIWYFILYYFM